MPSRWTVVSRKPISGCTVARPLFKTKYILCVCVCVCVYGYGGIHLRTRVCVRVWLDSPTDEAVLVSIFIADINVNMCRGLN